MIKKRFKINQKPSALQNNEHQILQLQKDENHFVFLVGKCKESLFLRGFIPLVRHLPTTTSLNFSGQYQHDETILLDVHFCTLRIITGNFRYTGFFFMAVKTN